ncbi:MAG: ATP-binding cassette domain-containing protein [Pseudomonadota bacterium]
MLQCKQISQAFQNRLILNEVSFTLETTKHLLVLGPSGCGKTTLLFILAGLHNPDKGAVYYDETNLYDLKEEERDRFRGHHIGIIFQAFHLIKILSVKQNLLLTQTLSGQSTDESRINDMLERLDLADKMDQKAMSLSIGEAQRLAVARAVIGNPKWILCDEPTSALDDDHAGKMLTLLQQEATRCQASLIIVTHDRRVRSSFDAHNIMQM